MKEIFIYNQKSIQILSITETDKIQLKLYISLFEEIAYSIAEKNNLWHIYGKFKQYNFQNIRFHNINKLD